ncbi:Long-chain acyl-CoA synthetase [Fasciolopsis buskii]|uniref:long-chain-fatty-acid--CoA ligase n=1 Tax=Fasciolopsis buskii TaxID=27845 RepID=A0A8E0RQS3_9TREM|nr:Long-chain acyl-CoA synthetase [Fasciolopsis buski]
MNHLGLHYCFLILAMDSWLVEKLFKLPFDSVTMLSMATASVAAYFSYQCYSRLFNVLYYEPSPFLQNQSIVVDPEEDIRTTVLEGETDWDPNIVTLYDIFTKGLKIAPTLPCLGKRPSFEEPIRWYTYEEVDDHIRCYGSALVHICGDSTAQSPIMIGIYGPNSPEWVEMLMACSAYAFVAVPLYDTLGREAVAHVCHQTQPRLIVCHTAQLARSILQLTDSTCQYCLVLTQDEELEQLRLEKSGDVCQIIDLDEFKKANPDDLCLIGYTSGSSGVPKGVLFTHRNCLQPILGGRHIWYQAVLPGAPGFVKVPFPAESDGNPITKKLGPEQHVHFSYLPLAHCYERINVATFLSVGDRIGFITRDTNGLIQDMQDYRPHYFSTVPRILMRVHAQVMQRLGRSKLLHLLYHQAVAQKLAEQAQGVYRRSGLLDRLFFKPVRDKVGGNIKTIVSASAPLSNEVMNFTRAAFSCPVIEVYGLTEMGGILSATLLGEMEPGRTGTPHLGLQVKLIDVPEMNLYVKRDGLGEICVKGEACTKGYYKDEANTKDLFEPGGFLRTGDIGTWTKVGEYVTPNKVEDLYASSVLVNNVFVDGDSRETFVVAVVEPNFPELRKFLISQADSIDRGASGLRSLDVENLSDGDLCRDDRVRHMVLTELNAIGKAGGLKGFEQVRLTIIHL